LFRNFKSEIKLCSLLIVVSATTALRLSFFNSLTAGRAVTLSTIGDEPDNAKNDVRNGPKEDDESNSNSCSYGSSRLTCGEAVSNQAVTVRSCRTGSRHNPNEK